MLQIGWLVEQGVPREWPVCLENGNGLVRGGGEINVNPSWLYFIYKTSSSSSTMATTEVVGLLSVFVVRES